MYKHKLGATEFVSEEPPSMAKAATITNSVLRHSYVFDNGLSSPDFFDLEKRMASEEFGILRERIASSDSVLELGCFTGLNLLGLAKSGHQGHLCGIDFVRGAINWLDREAKNNGVIINAQTGMFDRKLALPLYPHEPGPQLEQDFFDRIVCFDVLEHQRNVGDFLDGVRNYLTESGKALFLVPVGKEFYDCGHIAFFPDAECLQNVLSCVLCLEVDELFELKTCRKLFASCRRRM